MDSQGFALRRIPSHISAVDRALLLFVRFHAIQCFCWLRRIVRRLCAGLCAAFRRSLPVSVRHLEVVPCSDLFCVANPRADGVERVLRYQFRLTACSVDVTIAAMPASEG